jgi:hypothetical protein
MESLEESSKTKWRIEMKKIFEILQKGWCPVILGIIFLSVQKWTADFGLTATYTVLVASAIIFRLVLWNLLSSWEVKKQGYLVANGGAAFSGIASSLVIIAYAYGDMNDKQLNLFLLISFSLGIAIFLWGMFQEWVRRTWDEDEGQVLPTRNRPQRPQSK